MFLPPLKAKDCKSVVTLRFGGLDLREKADRGSLSDAENLCADAYPALAPRKSRQQVVKESGITYGVLPEYTGEPLSAFTGVKDGGFYYQGTRIGTRTLSEEETSIVDFNGKLCIFPDKLYYNYLPDPVTGESSQDLESMEKSLTLTGVTFYSKKDEVTGDYTAYLKKSGGGFDRFSPGESIVISGCSKAENNTCSIQGSKDAATEDAIVSAIVKTSSADYLYLILYNRSGAKTTFTAATESASITIKVSIPDMDHVCVHNNRLWGTSKNGEYIYASKLGDCCNFHSFQGLAEDSWYSMIGTPGTFTGIVSYRSSVVAFKRHCIHHVYGDAPQNYAIPKQTTGGCIDGRSIQELGGVLYYLSHSGFCSYSGGEPYGVSHQLPVSYTSAVAGSDGIRYYASACRRDGTCELLVYDPDKNIWHREDDTTLLQFLFDGDCLYGVCEDGIFAFHQGDEVVRWSFTTQPFTYDTLRFKGPNTLYLLADTEQDAQLSVSVSYDGEDFLPCGTLSSVEGIRSHRLPIRFRNCDSFRIHLEGQGKAVIHALELSVYQGGKTYAV